ncbi:MAG: alanine--glyoxylate aminotransferase family protein, partial [Planctomycetota bacterium]
MSLSSESIPTALTPSRRVLMGPGPSDVDDAVLAAMARPTLGHLDPEFLQVMDELRSMLRRVFQTENELTMPMSGTGSAGMETCMANLLEPGDRVLVGVNGVFGTRMAEVARRCGAEVTEVKGEWGRAFT